jgi:Na+/H+ antiporter NhaD/arsenite permease-like protein
VQTGLVKTILANAIMQEFIPFIVLLFSLYTIAGGIRITGDLQAHPMTNATFMAVGAILASFIGTTGAAMLLIRPLLETNSERKHVAHTVVIFIFIVCNCGGRSRSAISRCLGISRRRCLVDLACGLNGCSSTDCSS